MKANNTVFDLLTVYTTLTYMEIVEILDEFVENKDELEDTLFVLRLDSNDMDKRIPAIMAIEEQLEYLDKNIKIFGDAILCHESKAFDKKMVLGNLALIGLN